MIQLCLPLKYYSPGHNYHINGQSYNVVFLPGQLDLQTGSSFYTFNTLDGFALFILRHFIPVSKLKMVGLITGTLEPGKIK